MERRKTFYYEYLGAQESFHIKVFSNVLKADQSCSMALSVG
jgi:hypothetical protein